MNMSIFRMIWSERTLGEFIDPSTLRRLAGSDNLNMTCLALNMSEYVNGVAKRHAETSRLMFPGYRVHSVTNGVHPFHAYASKKTRSHEYCRHAHLRELL